MGEGALEDQVGGVALDDHPAGGERRVGLSDLVDGGDVERRHQQQLGWPVGGGQTGHGVADQVDVLVVGLAGQVLDLDVDPHALAGLERLGEGGHVVGQVGGGKLAEQPAVLEVCVVVGDQHAVGGAPHVELDPVGARLAGGPVGRHGVVNVFGGVAPVGDGKRTVGHALGNLVARPRAGGRVPPVRHEGRGRLRAG
jgi:hypothetical protein